MATSESGITKVLVAGAGTMGQWISACCVDRGFDVHVYDINPEALAKACTEEITDQIGRHGPDWRRRSQEILRTLTVQTDLSLAVQDVDLVIECLPERLNLKQEFFRMVSRLCPPPVVLTTNTSFLLPSQMESVIKSPERFTAMHFVSDTYFVELMGHDKTDPMIMERLGVFARQIAHRPITIPRENVGYLSNALLGPLMHAAISLVANGLASVEDVDRMWMRGMGASLGPFAQLDSIGLQTVMEITKLNAALSSDPQLKRNVDFLMQYVSENRLGVATKRGFYEYPNPAYQDPDFLSVEALPGPSRIAVERFQPDNRPLAFLDSGVKENSDTYEVHIDPRLDGFWRDHVLRGTPLLPAAAVIEIVAEASSKYRPRTPLCLCDLSFVNGIRSFNGQPQKLSVEFDGDEFYVFQEFRDRSGKLIDPRRLCVSGRLALACKWPSTSTDRPPGVVADLVYEDQAPNSNWLGPTMRGPQHAVLGDQVGECSILVMPMERVCVNRKDSAFLHSIPLIDAALVSCTAYTQYRLNDAWQLPYYIGSVQLGRPPREDETCRARFDVLKLSVGEPETEFNITVLGEDGAHLMAITAYKSRVMGSEPPSAFHLKIRPDGAKLR